MKKIKFTFKTLSDEEIDAKNYDLSICENLFGNSTFVLKNDSEIKYLKLKSVYSALTRKKEIVLTDMTDNHIVGIVEDMFNKNNIHNRNFTTEIESDVVVPQPLPEPTPPVDTPKEDIPQPEPKAEPSIPSENENNESGSGNLPKEEDPPINSGENTESGKETEFKESKTSDEFTYEKTPGTISKVFLHLYDSNDLTPIDPSKCTFDTDGYLIDVDGVKRYTINNGAGSLANARQITNDNFDIVTAFDVSINQTCSMDLFLYYLANDSCNYGARNNLLSKIKSDAKNASKDYIFTAKHYNGTKISLSSADSSVDDIEKFIHTAFYSGDHSGYNTHKTWVNVMSSDKMFSIIDNFGLEFLEEGSHGTRFDDYEDITNDNCSTMHLGAVSIVKKAIEQGRALDIGIDLRLADVQPIRQNLES